MIEVLNQNGDEVTIKLPKRQSVIELVIQHDYIGVFTNGIVSTDKTITLGNHSCNYLVLPVQIQIPIRDFSQVILPLLNEHKYLTKQHLLNSDGASNYTWDKSVIKFYDSEKKCYMYAIREAGSDKYEYISERLYKQFYGTTTESKSE